MATQITLSIPEELLAQAERIALLTRQDVHDLLAESIALPSIQDELYLGASPEEAREMALEEAAWHRLHPDLLKTHQGQYVAIFQEEVVDHDPSFDAVFQRICKRFPEQFVWIAKVRAEPIPILQVRSPRLIR